MQRGIRGIFGREKVQCHKPFEAVAHGALAFSLGQLLMMLGNMGLRTYQVSDLEERYSMGEYVVNRIISCALMMLCTCVYGIATRCSGEKFAALLLIVGTKMIDAFADVFEGQLQKEHRLDLAGISMTIRMAVTTLLCLGLLMVTRQLMVACGCCRTPFITLLC